MPTTERAMPFELLETNKLSYWRFYRHVKEGKDPIQRLDGYTVIWLKMAYLYQHHEAIKYIKEKKHDYLTNTTTYRNELRIYDSIYNKRFSLEELRKHRNDFSPIEMLSILCCCVIYQLYHEAVTIARDMMQEMIDALEGKNNHPRTEPTDEHVQLFMHLTRQRPSEAEKQELIKLNNSCYDQAFMYRRLMSEGLLRSELNRFSELDSNAYYQAQIESNIKNANPRHFIYVADLITRLSTGRKIQVMHFAMQHGKREVARMIVEVSFMTIIMTVRPIFNFAVLERIAKIHNLPEDLTRQTYKFLSTNMVDVPFSTDCGFLVPSTLQF